VLFVGFVLFGLLLSEVLTRITTYEAKKKRKPTTVRAAKPALV
jgi:hypothetical protein